MVTHAIATSWLGGSLVVGAGAPVALSDVTWEGAGSPGANPFVSYILQVSSGTVTLGGENVDATKGIELAAPSLISVQQTANLEGKYAFSSAGATLRITAEIARIS